MDPERVSTLAAIGLAARATSPSLLHAMRGCLHDVTMLVALLQPARVASSATPDAAKITQRLGAINAQLESLEHSIGLLGAMLQSPGSQSTSTCTGASALPDVLRLLQDETSRQRIRFEHDLGALPAHIAADERALQRALLACGAWIAQHAGERATLRLLGRDEDGAAVFEFEVSGGASLASLPRDEVALVAVLVESARGTLIASSKLRIAFPEAPARAATA